MTQNGYKAFAAEFRGKIVSAVRRFMSDERTIDLTRKMSQQLREIIGLSEAEEIPKKIFTFLPKAVEVQEHPDASQLFVLVTTAVPKKVDGELRFDRANSVDVKMISRLYPDKILFVSGGVLTEFKKPKMPVVRHRNPSAATGEAPLDSLLPTFVRTKTMPAFPELGVQAPRSIQIAKENNSEK